MILDVVKVQQVEQEEKPTIYKVTCKGTDYNLVKMTLTIESDSKVDIQKYIPLMIGERRGVDFRILNRTLDEFSVEETNEGDNPSISMKLGDCEEIHTDLDTMGKAVDILEKRKQAASELE